MVRVCHKTTTSTNHYKNNSITIEAIDRAEIFSEGQRTRTEMYMKPTEETSETHHLHTHQQQQQEPDQIGYKMVNMTGTSHHQLESADNCRSVRTTIDQIESNSVQSQFSPNFPSPLTQNGHSACRYPSNNNSNSLNNNIQPTRLPYPYSPGVSQNNNIINNHLNMNSDNNMNNMNMHSVLPNIVNSNNRTNGQAMPLISSYQLPASMQTLTVALIYYREVTISGVTTSRQERELPVGTLVIDKSSCRQMTARQLREKIQKDIPHDHFNDFNTNYVFLTRQGSPLEYKQEEQVAAWSVINSKRQQIRFRLESNIFHVMMSNDIEKSQFMLMFTITSAFDNNLKEVRELIRSRMLQIIPEKPFCATNDFFFLCDRRITVSRNNEANMKLVDILSGTSSIKLLCETDRFYKPDNRGFIGSVDNLPTALSCSNTQINQSERHNESPRKGINRAKSSKSRSSRSFLQTLRGTKFSKPSIQVMLSYARSDMSQYVKPLKEELTKLGLSVYLDVDEIKIGQDWQDSLNQAVQSVEYFVPLISANYGRTKWTNKEVKLADIRQKMIIPINFLEAFPPECLAIQFCTTQYIPWQGRISHDSTGNEKFATWSPENIKEVAKCVFERIKELKNEITDKTREASTEPLMSKTRDVIPETEAPIVSNRKMSLATAPVQRKKIIISVHPDQTEVAQHIKNLLGDDYQIWVSSEGMAEELPMPKPTAYVSNQCDRIPEEEIIVTSKMRDYALKFGETNKSRTITKVPVDPESRTNINPRMFMKEAGKNFTSSLSPDKKEELKKFQEEAKGCDLVLIIESGKYYNSRTSEKQVFYLGNRKKIIRITTDQQQPPVWYSKINPQITKTLDYKSSTFDEDLRMNIKNVIENKVKFIVGSIEGQEKVLAEAFQDFVPDLEKLIYICGSTNIVKNSRNEAICREISSALYDTPKLCPVTNGFYGVSSLVAQMYEDQRRQRTGQIGNGSNEGNSSTDSQIIHLLPVRDSKDCSKKAAQKKDTTFDILPHGRTFFYGNSMEDRDMNVAKVIDVCIFLGGTKGENVREFEEFRWNDHYVIPIPFIDEDDSNQGEPLPSTIYECPRGVTQENWNKLMDTETPPAEVAKTLITVICEIKRHIYEHGQLQSSMQTTTSSRKKRVAKRNNKLTRPGPSNSIYWDPENTSIGNAHSIQDVTDGHESDTSKSKFKINFKLPLFNKNKS